jgi:sugar phosphate isomerase/epimerase
MKRRAWIKKTGAFGAAMVAPKGAGSDGEDFSLQFVLSSAMYGNLPLEEVLKSVARTGASSVDIWRKVHATHREQIKEMGDEAFQKLLQKHQTTMSVSTCYPLGPFRQDAELRWVKKNGGRMTVCGSGRLGDPDPVGAEAKRQVKAFFEKLKPHYELAEELGVTMAIENHKNSMLSSPDSIRYVKDLNPSKNVGIAFAPHHLHDAIGEIPKLISHLGKEMIPFFYFQEHHPSSKKKMGREEERKQLPGYGTLDYLPILKSLKEIGFNGLSEIFMHPVPRGIPVMPTADEINELIKSSRGYLSKCLARI